MNFVGDSEFSLLISCDVEHYVWGFLSSSTCIYIFMYPNSLSHGFIIDRIDVIERKPSLAIPNHISRIRLVQIVFLRFQLCGNNAGLVMRSLQLVISWKLVFHAIETLSSWPTYRLRQWSARCSISWRFTLMHYKLFLLKGCGRSQGTCDVMSEHLWCSTASGSSLACSHDKLAGGHMLVTRPQTSELRSSWQLRIMPAATRRGSRTISSSKERRQWEKS